MLLILAAALLPVVALFVYIYKKDPQPEPLSWLMRALGMGVLIVIPVSFIEFGIQTLLFGAGMTPTTLFGTTVMAFLVAALPEEAFKLLALRHLLKKNPYFDEHVDGIVYAVCVGLGFAAVENCLFLFGEEKWQSVAILRALLSVPGHYAFAVLMGYYYSVYHFVDHSPKVAARVLLVPVLAHGVFDAIALSGTVNPYVGGVGFFVLIYFCVKIHKMAIKRITDMIEKDQENPNPNVNLKTPSSSPRGEISSRVQEVQEFKDESLDKLGEDDNSFRFQVPSFKD